MTEQTLNFETDVGKILHIVATALYRDRQIFLRELISNASDACDRLRYLAITNPELTADDPEFKIDISIDKDAGTLTIADNGIGMNRDSMIEDLGTIARSGSSAFLESMSGDSGKDMALIGQFGVGFYSCFMVADTVEVVSLRAGEDQAWRWASDGQGQFTIGEAEKEGRGTRITLHLKEEASEFLESVRLRTIVSTYSNHISLPIKMAATEEGEPETVNQASALWTRPRADITDEQYSEFYHHVAHAFDEPWHTIHWRAEGRIEYTGLLFIPQTPPMDIFAPERKHGIKLYVKRVFITDDCEGLAPGWMRFVRGLIDSEDLPLNVSRDLLQKNPLLTQIRKALVNRVLGELDTKAEKSPEEYATFWASFGSVLKEGLYEDFEHRDRLLKLVRFASTAAGGEAGKADALVSLDDYVGRMKEGQNAIYYISGEELATVAKSPQLEGFRAKGVEVLLMTDPVDEFWLPAIAEYEGKPFRSATRAGADLGAIAGDTKEDTGSDGDKDEAENRPGLDSLIVMVKLELGDAVKDVRVSERLTDSPVCLVSDEGDIDIRLERLLRQHNKLEEKVTRVLEINPTHPLIAALAEIVGDDGAGTKITDAAWLLLDQARILEGEALPDPNAFVRRLATLMAEGIKG